MEAVEAAAHMHELWPFFLENLPDCAVGEFRMTMRLGVGNAFVEKPGIQLVVALEPQPRRKKAFAYKTDLVFNLALLPARRRRAGHGLDEIMPAHLKKAAVVLSVFAGEDRLHRRFHIVINAALAGALEKGEGTVMRVEHHLLRLARIGTHEQHAAVAEPTCADLHGHRRTVQHDDFVAPVELVGLAGSKGERHIGRAVAAPRSLRQPLA